MVAINKLGADMIAKLFGDLAVGNEFYEADNLPYRHKWIKTSDTEARDESDGVEGVWELGDLVAVLGPGEE